MVHIEPRRNPSGSLSDHEHVRVMVAAPSNPFLALEAVGGDHSGDNEVLSSGSGDGGAGSLAVGAWWSIFVARAVSMRGGRRAMGATYHDGAPGCPVAMTDARVDEKRRVLVKYLHRAVTIPIVNG